VLGGLLLSALGQFFVECYAVRMSGGYFRYQLERGRVDQGRRAQATGGKQFDSLAGLTAQLFIRRRVPRGVDPVWAERRRTRLLATDKVLGCSGSPQRNLSGSG
jgi:hypothetical protein